MNSTMTSLQRQLERLRLPQTKVIQSYDQKKKVSLLFDKGEAANIEKKAFYEIGINGFNELQNFDKVFMEFESDLFTEESIQVNRSVQTQEVNDKLNAVIKRFLLCVSPYCLLKPAQKTLEWLLQRFDIHLYNPNDLMKCVLPYHEDKIFIRVVQLLDLQNDDRWKWLLSLQKDGDHLPRQAIISHCVSDLNFLLFIQNMVSDYVQEFSKSPPVEPRLRHVFVFYTQVVCGILNSQELSEKLTGVVIPFMGEGLRGKFTDYRSSSLMILGIILTHCKLTAAVLKSFLLNLTKYTVNYPDTFEEVLCCIILIFHTQNIKKLKRRFCKYLVAYPQFVVVLEKLGKQFKLDPFLVAFFHHLVPYALGNSSSAVTSGSSEDDLNISCSQYKKVLHNMLLYIPMETSTSFNVASCVLQAYIKQCSKLTNSNEFQVICGIIRLLESKHALALDESVQMCLKNESCPKVKEAVFSLLNSSLESARFKMLPDLGVSLTFGLHHPEAEVRIQAINFLVKQKFNVAEDSTFYEETLLMRLKDDSPDVVLTVLKAGEILWTLMDHRKLFPTLVEILIASDTKENWQTLNLSAVNVLITCPDQKMYPDILVSLFPFLIVMSTSDIPLLESVLKSKFATANSLSSDQCDSERAKDVIAQVIIKRVNASPHNERLSLMVSIFNSLPNHSSRKPIYLCFLLNVFFEIYEQQNKLSKLSYELCLLVLNHLKKILHKKSGIQKDMKKLMPWAQHFSTDQFRKQHCAKFLGDWISSLKIIDSLKIGGTFWEYRNDGSIEDVCIELIIHLFELLVKISSKYEEFQKSEQKLVNIFLGEMLHHDVFDKFLCFLWTSDTQDHTVAIINQLQLSALKTGYIWIKSVAPNYVRKWMLSPVPVMVSMIVALGSKMDMVRDAAASVLPVVYPRGHRKELPYHFFLKKLIANLNRIKSNSDLSKVISEIMLNEESDDSDTEKSKDISSRKQALKDIFDVIILETTPSYIINSILNVFREFNSIELVTQLTPLLSRLLGLAQKNALTKSQLQSLQCLLERFDKDIACHLTVSTCTLQLLCKAMSINQSATIEPQETQIQELAIKQIDKEFYMNLPNDESRQKVISCLFNAWVQATTMSTPELIRKSLKHFPMKSSYLEAELNIFEKTPIYSTVRENKRIQKLTDLEKGNKLDSLQWQRVTIVLEILQNKKKLSKPGILLPICFKLLSRVMELEENNSAEYLKQLLLSCICNISGRMIGDPGLLAELQSSQFNMELIVKCIRSSSSPQTHHHALLLLTVAAKINPELLLHNVMAVFTFVGGTMVRQDDTYTFNMIYRTLETVIPPLLAACEERAKTSQQEIGTMDDVVVMVLKVFVDAFPHIPSHRRVMLFPELTRIIGQGKHLWCLLLLLIEHFVVHGSTKSHAENPETNDGLPLELEFCLSLSIQFSPEQQLDAIYNSILYLSKLPPTTKQGTVKVKPPLPEKLSQWRSADVEIFNINHHTNKRLWHFKYATINFFVSLLSSTEFISQITTTSETVLQDNYQKLLETILHYLSNVSKMTEMRQDPEPARFWKMLCNQVSNLLDKVCSLLPDNVFIEVVSTLVNHKLTTVQRKSMELLNSKLQQFTDDLHEDILQLLLPLVKKLTNIVETKLLIEHSVDETNIMIGQIALFSLKLLCRRLAGRGVKEFQHTLRVATTVLKQRQDSVQLVACSVLCIGEVCSAPVSDEFLLKQFSLTMPSVITLFKNTDFLLGNSLLLLSTVTMMHRIVEHKSAFLSPYLSDILQYICFLSSLESLDIQNLVQRLKAVRSIVAMSIPSRVLIPTVAENYSIFLAEKTNCLPCLMTILSEHIANKMKKDDVISFLEELQQFFFICLDFRLDSNEVDKENLELIESEVITAIINMVMKLSEAKFKPMFLKFYDWATTDERKPLRVLVFYRLADSLAGSLRSLFPMFAGYIVKHMAHVLDHNHKDKNPSLKWKRHTSTLLTYIFDCAHKCFLYDTDGFVNKERFEVLMQPLVDQFENVHGRKYTERVISHLVPCLGQLAVATHDDILWKSLNYQVLLKTRHTEKEVRLASLAMLNELQQKLGEAYSTLLPETVPFLAELMEDEEVEKHCQLLISEMEKTFGESLQKYF